MYFTSDIHADNSRSSAFGVTSPLHSNLKPGLSFYRLEYHSQANVLISLTFLVFLFLPASYSPPSSSLSSLLFFLSPPLPSFFLSFFFTPLLPLSSLLLLPLLSPPLSLTPPSSLTSSLCPPPLTPLPSPPPAELTSKVPSTSSNKYNPLGESDEDRLEKLFSRSYQQETEEQNRDNRPVDTLSDKYQAVLEGQKQGERGKKKEEGEGGKNEGGDAPQPMVIDFTQLLARQSFPLPPDTAPAVAPARPSAPMDVPSPR